VLARIYIADTAHGQFVGDWTDDKKIAHIVQGKGTEGRCLEYLRNLVQHLEELGIPDARMTTLLHAALQAELHSVK